MLRVMISFFTGAGGDTLEGAGFLEEMRRAAPRATLESDDVCSQAGWKCFCRFARFPAGRALERFEGSGFVAVQHEVELRRQCRDQVVTAPFGAREIDHAD